MPFWRVNVTIVDGCRLKMLIWRVKVSIIDEAVD